MTISNLQWDHSKVNNDKDSIYSAIGLTDDRARQICGSVNGIIENEASFSGFVDKLIKDGLVTDANELTYAVFKAVEAAREGALRQLIGSIASKASRKADDIMAEMGLSDKPKS